MPKSVIPMGSEFGPNQVELGRVLELAAAHEGDGAALTTAVAAEYGWPHNTAKNTRLSMRRYGLLDDDDQVTEVGQRLLALRADSEALYLEFARHILVHLHGLDVVNAIDVLMRADDDKPTQLAIARVLNEQGITVSPSSTHVSKMIGWLRKAGVFHGDDYDSLDMARVGELVGASKEEMDVLAEMPEEQRSVLKALSNLPMSSLPDNAPLLANQVMEYAETLYGVPLNPKSFPREVLEPLQSAGYIRLDKAAKATGDEAGTREQHSGKPYLIHRTEKFANDLLEPLADALASTGIPLRTLLYKPLTEILAELESPDTGVKGKALEALAIRMMRLLGLEFRGWRKRANKASGYEVDAVFEGVRLVFSRWQIQCKNTPGSAVSLEDIAKEVGIAFDTKSNVILMVTTGKFSRDALAYADRMMRQTNLNIITLDVHDMEVLKTTPLAIVDIMNRKARRVMLLKALEEE